MTHKGLMEVANPSEHIFGRAREERDRRYRVTAVMEEPGRCWWKCRLGDSVPAGYPASGGGQD